MGNNNPFLKRLMKEESRDVIHSSAYAEAQNAGNIGTASVQSFAERQKIENNRTTVKGYRDSRVVNDALGGCGTKLKGYDAAHDASQRAAIRERFGGNGTNNGVNGLSGDVMEGGMTSDSRTVNPPARRNPGISR